MKFEGIKGCTPTRAVTVTGCNIFGRKSTLTLSPTPQLMQEEKAGALYWRCRHYQKSLLIPVSSNHAEYRKRRIALTYHSHSLEIIEHVSVLRFLGLTNTVIEGSGSPWPPYFGRAFEFWEALQGSLNESNTLLRWCTVPRALRIEHTHTLGGFTEWVPSNERVLTIRVTVRYPSHKEERHLECCLPTDRGLLMEALKSHTPGKPEWLRPLSALGSGLHLWRHHEHVHWMREKTLSESLSLYALHRLSDLLGALALVHPTSLPAGTVTSVFGGHKSDLQILRLCRPSSLVSL